MRSSPTSLNFFQRSTLMRDVTISLAALVTIILLGIGLAGYFVFAGQAETSLTKQADDLAGKLAEVMRAPLWNVDLASISQIAQAYEQSENVIGVRVMDGTGAVLYEPKEIREADPIIESRPVYYDSEREIGEVEIFLSRQQIRTFRQVLSLSFVGVGIVLVGGMIVTTRWLLGRFLQRPIQQLINGINTIASGDYQYRFQPFRQGEINEIVVQINKMATQIEERDRTLDQRVSARTRDLALAAEVGRRISQVRDLGMLLSDAVELIRQRFDLYYVQIYLVDPSGRSLVLRAGSGEVGAELFRRGHRLEINPGSINGRVVIERRAVIVADTLKSPTFRPNPLLPDTRAEMAVPLTAGDSVVGVLDLQSAHPGSLGEENLSVFEALAGQLAIAVSNANLFAQSEQERAAVEAQIRRQTLTGWQEFLDAVERSERVGYVFDQEGLAPLTQPLRRQPEGNVLALPFQVVGAEFGALQVERSTVEPWTAEDRALATSVALQAARRLDALRLLEQTESYRLLAEESARRLTREGWEDYFKSRPERLAYVYDQLRVQPLGEVPPLPEKTQTLPLRVDLETVGELAFDGIDQLDKGTAQLVEDVSGFLSSHIEGLRLNERTQQALIETEKLYGASARIVRSTTINDVLASVVETTILDQFDSASILLFTHPWDETMPEEVSLQGFWAPNMGEEIDLGDTIPLADIPFTNLLRRDAPVFFADTETDGRLDDIARMAMVAVGRSVAIFPLVAAEQWIGWLSASADEKKALSANDARQIQSLVAQAATVIQSIRLYAQTQSALAQTGTLYEIGRLLNNANNVDDILNALSLPGQQQGCNEACLMYFDSDTRGEPEWMSVVALWRQTGQPVLTVGSRVYVPDFPSAPLLLSSPNAPLFISDILVDAHIDANFKAMMVQAHNRAFILVPITQAGHWLGLLTFGWVAPRSFSENERETYSALTGLATPAVQSRRLLIQAQTRAQREQFLRQITSAVRSSTDAAVIMRTAVREVGTVLGRKALIRLERSAIASSSPAQPSAAEAPSPTTDATEN